MLNTEIIVGLFSGFIGGLIVAIIKYFLDKKREIQIRLNQLMEEKYRSLLIFMACALDINKRRYFTLNEQIPNRTTQDYINQIKEYYYHSILYSPDEVLLSIKNFIQEPSKENYIKTAVEMRKDLWRKGTKLNIEDIVIEKK